LAGSLPGGAGLPHPTPRGTPPNEAPLRVRHPAWVKANALARQWFGPTIVEEEVRYAREYVESVGGVYLLFLCLEDAGGGCRPIPKPYIHRLSGKYGDRVWALLRRWYYPVLRGYRYFLMITLTIDPKAVVSQYDAYRSVMRAWNTLLTRIRRRYPWVVVIRTAEWQGNGIGIHIHALVAGVNYIPKEWVAESWRGLSNSGWSIELTPVRGNADYALRYLFKYLMKGFGNGVDNLSAVINWAVNAKAFGVSMPRRLRERLAGERARAYIKHLEHLNAVCPGGFVYLGKIEHIYVEAGLALDFNWVRQYFKLDEYGLPRGPPRGRNGAAQGQG
jgi:hypothetical protein